MVVSRPGHHDWSRLEILSSWSRDGGGTGRRRGALQILEEHADDRRDGQTKSGNLSRQLRPPRCGDAGRQHLPVEVARRDIGASRL
eukprot:3608525-Pyramimonas_sp.AAC.1